MIVDVLNWVDLHPASYSVFSYGAAALLLGYAVAQVAPAAAHRTTRWPREFIAAGLIVLVVFAGRWPLLCAGNFLNPDESQQVAGAITLLRDPVFWRSVDGATAGPVNFYLLSFIGLTGLHLTYFAARSLGLLLVFGGIWFTYKTVRLTYSPAEALLGILPLVFFFSWVTEGDLTHFSTEHVPVFLLACSAYFLLRPLLRPQTDRGQIVAWAISGLAAGVAPWAKLQSVIAVAALLALAAVLAWKDTTPVALRVRRLVAYSIGLGAASVLFLGMVLITGEFEDFYRSYIAANFVYATGGSPLQQILRTFWDVTKEGLSFHGFAFTGLTCLVALSLHLAVRRERPKAVLVFAMGWLAIGICTTLSPRRGFPHYLMFSIMPLGLFVAVTIAEFLRAYSECRFGRLRVSIVLILVILGLSVGFRIQAPPPFTLGSLAWHWELGPSPAASPLLPYLRQGDTLAVWGWYPHIYVELGIPQAIRDAHSHRQIEDSPQRAYYRDRYLADLRKNRPAAFVDAVGPGGFLYSDRVKAGHEIFPELAAYVKEHYTEVADEGGARIYIRKERMTETSLLEPDPSASRRSGKPHL